MSILEDFVVKNLRNTADLIEVGNSELSETEAMDILSAVAHRSLSREQASSYLNLSLPHFDAMVRNKEIPKGRKVSGFKEKRWYQDELDVCLYKIKKNRKEFGNIKFNV